MRIVYAVPRTKTVDRLLQDRERRAQLGLDEYLTTREAATLLRCSESYLRHTRATGDGPPSVKLGSKVLYRRVDIDAWAERQATASTGPRS